MFPPGGTRRDSPTPRISFLPKRAFCQSQVRKMSPNLLFSFQTPQDSEWVPTLVGADESALFQRLDGIAIGR